MEKWREDLYSDALYHHGILGQKWGIRRYQNKDGTLTSLGQVHYSVSKEHSAFKVQPGFSEAFQEIVNTGKRDWKEKADLRDSILYEVGKMAWKDVSAEYKEEFNDWLKNGFPTDDDDDEYYDLYIEEVTGDYSAKVSDNDYADSDLELLRYSIRQYLNSVTMVKKNPWLDGTRQSPANMDRMYSKYNKQYNLDEKLFGKQVKHSAMNDSDYKDIGRQWVEELSDGLEHYNTKGSKWGNRRYQNKDGSLTPLGRIHYGVGDPRESGGRGGKFARKSASREDEVISRMKDIHERDASERDQWNREVSESVAKNVQSIMENERARKAEPDNLRRMREENESIAKMLDGISDKDFDSVVSDMVDKADLGKGVKAASKYIDKDSVSKAAKAAADAAKNGQNPDAAFASAMIESVGKNVRKDKVKNNSGPSGQDVAKATIDFFERYKDLPNALNSLGGHAGKISSLYNDVKAYQRLKSVDINSMSDDDLRNAINRLTLEQNYTRLVSTNVGAGERRVNNFINGAGASLQIGGSIVQLANAISKARKKY